MFAALILTFCRITIALVFALSAGGKALGFHAFQEAVTDFQLLPPSWSKAAASTFLGTEFAVVLLMAIGGRSVLLIGFLLAAGLLVAFSAALVAALRRNMLMACNCFGHTERHISPYDVIRNALLTLCSLAGVWAALVGPLQGFSGTELVLVGPMAVCCVVLVTNLRDVVETLRHPFRSPQQGG